MNIGQKDYHQLDLYTNTRLGKFESCRSERMANMLYDFIGHGGADDEMGDVTTIGVHYSKVNRKNGGGWIIEVTERGFFDYLFYPADEDHEYRKDWEEISDYLDTLYDQYLVDIGVATFDEAVEKGMV